MKYVVDSSVAVKWGLSEVNSDKAIHLRDEFRNANHQLISPDFFPYEVGHALTRAERQKRLRIGGAWDAWKAIMTDCPDLHPGLSLMQRATAISSQMRIGIYDCLYVALAEREGCELITADDKLVRTLQPVFPLIIDLAAIL